MPFGLRDEVHGGGASCYGSCIVAPHPELMRPTSVCGTDVLEPGMTIGYPIRHPECDPVGSAGGYEQRSWLRRNYAGAKGTMGVVKHVIGTIRLGMHKGLSYRMTHSSYVWDVRKRTLDVDVHVVVVDVQTRKSDYQGMVVDVQLVKSDYQALVVDVRDAKVDVHSIS